MKSVCKHRQQAARSADRDRGTVKRHKIQAASETKGSKAGA